MLCFVLINSLLLNLLCVWSGFKRAWTAVNILRLNMLLILYRFYKVTFLETITNTCFPRWLLRCAFFSRESFWRQQFFGVTDRTPGSSQFWALLTEAMHVDCNHRLFIFGLNKILFIHRNRKLNKYVQETQKQYAYLSVTYGQNDNYTDIYDGKMANCCQKVGGNKTNQRPKQRQKQKTKSKTKQAKLLFLLSELLNTYCSVLE